VPRGGIVLKKRIMKGGLVQREGLLAISRNRMFLRRENRSPSGRSEPAGKGDESVNKERARGFDGSMDSDIFSEGGEENSKGSTAGEGEFPRGLLKKLSESNMQGGGLIFGGGGAVESTKGNVA